MFHIGDIVRSNQSDELNDRWKDITGKITRIEDRMIVVSAYIPRNGSIEHDIRYYTNQLVIEIDHNRIQNITKLLDELWIISNA